MSDFLLLMSAGTFIAGVGSFAVFWPLSLMHLRERHAALAAELGAYAFMKPSAIVWLLRGGYRVARDPLLSGLATPARISIIAATAGAILMAVLWPLSRGLTA